MTLGNCKLKQQGDITTHLFKWLKSKTSPPPIPGKDAKQQELSFIAGENVKVVQPLWKTVWQFVTD